MLAYANGHVVRSTLLGESDIRKPPPDYQGRNDSRPIGHGGGLPAQVRLRDVADGQGPNLLGGNRHGNALDVIAAVLAIEEPELALNRRASFGLNTSIRRFDRPRTNGSGRENVGFVGCATPVLDMGPWEVNALPKRVL